MIDTQDPSTPPYDYQQLPAALTAWPQWVLWRRVWLPEKSKFTKQPLRADGRLASVNRPGDWSDFTTALFAWQMGTGDGLGFVFTKSDPFVFIDLDHAIEAGQWRELPAGVLQACPTWGELSQSGDGVHLIGEAVIPHAGIDHQQGVEVYDWGRYVALTGWPLWPEGQAPGIENIQTGVEWVLPQLRAQMEAGERDQPVPELVAPVALEGLNLSPRVRRFLETGEAEAWHGDRSAALLAGAMGLYRLGLSDTEVLSTLWHYCEPIAREHRGRGDPVEWLWRYTCLKAQTARPPSAADVFGPAADAEGRISGNPAPVAGELMPTGETPASRLQALLARATALGDGAANDATTITTARAILFDALNLDAGSRIAVGDAVRKEMTWTKTELREVWREVERAHQAASREAEGPAEIFERYIYIGGLHQFMNKTSGDMYRPEAFVAMYQHVCQDFRERVLHTDGVAKVANLEFDPTQPRFFYRDDEWYYNTWRGLSDTGELGDITPWWQHLFLLVPDETERGHLLDWLAFTLQYPGRKINHCVLMGGSQGIGKDTLFWPLARALGVHCTQITADTLARDFNSYLDRIKLLIIQEADIGHRRGGHQIANKLKPLMARPPDTLSINRKGLAEYDIQNIVHSILLTNEQRPSPVAGDDRRYFVIGSDLRVTDPDTGAQLPEWREYFDGLWAWLAGPDDGQGPGLRSVGAMAASGGVTPGWRHVVAWLLSRDLSAFNPKAAPPMTECKRELQEASRGSMESLLEAMIEGRRGPFVRDAVTSEALVAWFNGEGQVWLRQYGIENATIARVGGGLRTLGVPRRKIHTPSGAQRKVWLLRSREYLMKEASGEGLARYLELE